MYVCMYVCMHVCMYVCMYVWQISAHFLKKIHELICKTKFRNLRNNATLVDRHHHTVFSMNYINEELRFSLGRLQYLKCRREVRLHRSELWGEIKWNSMAPDTVDLALYRDVKKASLDQLLRLLGQSHPLSRDGLEHNIQMAREWLRAWAEPIIETTESPRTLSLRSARANLGVPEGVSNISVWVDSVDFPFRTPRKHSTKSKHYSYKTKCFARRYLVFSDVMDRVLHVIGPVSPKVLSHFRHKAMPDLT